MWWTAAAGAVAVVQRFGAALNLNVHIHALVLDGVYAPDGSGGMSFRAHDREDDASDGKAVLELRRRWTDGTTHLVFDPVELLERLAAGRGAVQRDRPEACPELPACAASVKGADGAHAGRRPNR